jgi:hypothetical protein
MHLTGPGDQGPKHHRCGARVVQGGVRRRDVERELFHKASQPWGLSLREVQHKPGQRSGVDDRVLERALESSAHQPGVEGIVAVLDENSALSKSEESPASVAKLRRADQHRTVDVMSLLGIRVDRCTAVDERIEEGERPCQLESFRAQLQDEERRIAGCLDVDGDELRIVQLRLRPDLGRVDGDLLPGHRLRGAARLEKDRLHDGRRSNADLRNWISSRVIALRSSTAAT